MSSSDEVKERGVHILWDTEITLAEFRSKIKENPSPWAILRLLEYGRYREVREWLGFPALVKHWPHYRSQLRSESRKRGFDFLVRYLKTVRPEWLTTI